ncbi:MAG: ATP-grasp domain-containing protein [Ectothiorhodospiraceae bacterium]|nr:ATP-grasp domain-containing protein [Ectothiorhodospiraceae bacterium]
MADFNILFTSAGRRVSLLRCFRKALNELGIRGKIIAADAGLSAPASFIADERLLVPRVSDPKYIGFLLGYCQENNIRLLISLIDSDLVLLSQYKDAFEKINTTLLVCDEETNKICFNKHNTYRFFTDNNIPTPYVFTEVEVAGLSGNNYPVLIKPWDGSCSIGVTKINNSTELAFFYSYIRHAMVQEFIQGDEYTCDVYVDFSGKVRCVVPRKRLETRAGEVSKGVTVRDLAIIKAVKGVVEKLPHGVGCITVQCFKNEDGVIKFIEINPRFGGGIPLSIKAGADFSKWIIQEVLGLGCDANGTSWEDDLVMLRYDDEIFVPGSQVV